MKKLKLKSLNLGLSEVLTREQLKNVMGADGSYAHKCSDDRICSLNQVGDGGCATMQTGQCRCVRYAHGVAVESVPSEWCIL